MRWDGDETQARAEAEDCSILLLLAAAATLSPTPTRRHLFGFLPPRPGYCTSPPASSPCFPIHFIPCPLSRLSLYSMYCINCNRTPQSTHIEIPDRGKFDQILYTHMASSPLSHIYILPGNRHPLFPFSNASRCARMVTVTNKRRSKNTVIYFRLLTATQSRRMQHSYGAGNHTPPLPLKRGPKKGFVAYVGLGARR